MPPAYLDQQAPLEQQVQQVLMEQLVPLDLVQPEPPGLMEQQVQQVQLETMVPQDQQDHRDQQVLPEPQV